MLLLVGCAAEGSAHERWELASHEIASREITLPGHPLLGTLPRATPYTLVTRVDVDRVAAGAEPTGEARVLDAEAQLGEALFMGLRLTEGIATDLFRVRFGQDVWTRYGEALAPAVEAGLLVREMGRIRLTRRGMLLANEVMQVFV